MPVEADDDDNSKGKAVGSVSNSSSSVVMIPRKEDDGDGDHRHELKFVSCSCRVRVWPVSCSCLIPQTRIEIRVVFVFAKFVSCKFVSDTNTRHDDTNCQPTVVRMVRAHVSPRRDAGSILPGYRNEKDINQLCSKKLLIDLESEPPDRSIANLNATAVVSVVAHPNTRVVASVVANPNTRALVRQLVLLVAALELPAISASFEEIGDYILPVKKLLQFLLVFRLITPATHFDFRSYFVHIVIAGDVNCGSSKRKKMWVMRHSTRHVGGKDEDTSIPQDYYSVDQQHWRCAWAGNGVAVPQRPVLPLLSSSSSSHNVRCVDVVVLTPERRQSHNAASGGGVPPRRRRRLFHLSTGVVQRQCPYRAA
ncbi:hypothetical protein LXL04_027510 [Taraxacum kok-saghyz]